MDTLSKAPLLFQPGTRWDYGFSTDVLGRVVEVVSGKSLGQFLGERVFQPLRMTDTGFTVPAAKHGRTAHAFATDPDTGKPVTIFDATAPATFECGGGCAVSTAGDYVRFAQMLLGRGEHEDTRLLGSRTVDYMAQNHLPGHVDLEAFGRPLFAETTFDGVGFGLGFSVVDDPAKNKVLSSKGDYGWGGAASTVFWVDPVEEITVVFLTQLLPSTTHPIRPQLKQLVNQALVD